MKKTSRWNVEKKTRKLYLILEYIEFVYKFNDEEQNFQFQIAEFFHFLIASFVGFFNLMKLMLRGGVLSTWGDPYSTYSTNPFSINEVLSKTPP